MPSCLPAALAPTPFSVKTGIPMNFGIRKNFDDSADRRCGAALPTLATSTAARAASSTMPATTMSLRLRMNPPPVVVSSLGDAFRAAAGAHHLLVPRACEARPEPGRLESAERVSGQDGGEQEHADDDVLRVSAEVVELHAVAQLGEEHDGEGDAENRPRAAEDVDAAEHDGRHDVEQRAVGRVGARRAEEADVDEPGDPGHQPRDAEDGDADGRDGHAGEAG